MSNLTILVDTREQSPWTFDSQPATTERATLKTADYTVEPFCEYDKINDTYLPSFGIERKSGEDFLKSITHRRDAFEAEVQRADDWTDPLTVIIEEPWTTYENNLGFMQYRDVSTGQVRGTVQQWSDNYNVEFTFAGNRETAQRKGFEILSSRLRAMES